MNEGRDDVPFRDLRSRTKQFSLRVIHMCRALPRDDVTRELGRQVLRSGTSPGAHYREACRARSTAEFVSKMNGGVQELDETAYWIELLIESRIVGREKLQPLWQEADELMAIFVTCIRNAKEE